MDTPSMDGRGHGVPCAICGEKCDMFAGNPNRWPLVIVPVWRVDWEAGKAEVHCTGCVTDAMGCLRELVDAYTAHILDPEDGRARRRWTRATDNAADLIGEPCSDCLSATGGVCRKHQEPECTCYEMTGGHMPGCAFNRAPLSPSEFMRRAHEAKHDSFPSVEDARAEAEAERCTCPMHAYEPTRRIGVDGACPVHGVVAGPLKIDRSKEWWMEKAKQEEGHEVSAGHADADKIGRWERGFRNIVTILVGPGATFEIQDIVERVRALKGGANVAAMRAADGKPSPWAQDRAAKFCNEIGCTAIHELRDKLPAFLDQVFRELDETNALAMRLCEDTDDDPATAMGWFHSHMKFCDICDPSTPPINCCHAGANAYAADRAVADARRERDDMIANLKSAQEAHAAELRILAAARDADQRAVVEAFDKAYSVTGHTFKNVVAHLGEQLRTHRRTEDQLRGARVVLGVIRDLVGCDSDADVGEAVANLVKRQLPIVEVRAMPDRATLFINGHGVAGWGWYGCYANGTTAAEYASSVADAVRGALVDEPHEGDGRYQVIGRDFLWAPMSDEYGEDKRGKLHPLWEETIERKSRTADVIKAARVVASHHVSDEARAGADLRAALRALDELRVEQEIVSDLRPKAAETSGVCPTCRGTLSVPTGNALNTYMVPCPTCCVGADLVAKLQRIADSVPDGANVPTLLTCGVCGRKHLDLECPPPGCAICSKCGKVQAQATSNAGAYCYCPEHQIGLVASEAAERQEKLRGKIVALQKELDDAKGMADVAERHDRAACARADRAERALEEAKAKEAQAYHDCLEAQRQRDGMEQVAEERRDRAKKAELAAEAAQHESAELRAKVQWFVDKAADEKLDGYRELGSRAAAAENERDDAKALAEKYKKALQEARTESTPPRQFATYGMGPVQRYQLLANALQRIRDLVGAALEGK